MAQAYPQRQQQGWDATSHDYNLHISNIERMTSVLPDVPRYPILHRFFNNKPFNPPEQQVQQQQQTKNTKVSTRSKKKVQILDQNSTISEDRDSSEDSAVDAETDGFIKQRRRGFELCKWKTFKLH